MSLLRLICFSLFFSFAALSCAGAQAQTPSERLESWEKTLADTVEAMESEAGLTADELSEARKDFKTMRAEAGEVARAAEKEQEKLRPLLEALGEKPSEDAKVREDEAVTAKREDLQQRVTAQDGVIKRASLVITRANDMLDKLLQYEQMRQTARLFSRQATIVGGDYFASLRAAFGESVDYVKNSDTGDLIISLALFLSFFAAFSGVSFITLYSAQRRLRQDGRLTRGANATALFVCCAAASFLALLQFRGGTLAMPEFKLLTTAAASVAASVAALLALYPVQMSDSRNFTSLWRKALKLTRLALFIAIPAALGGFIYLAAYITLLLFSAFFGLSVFISVRGSIERFARKNGDNTETPAGKSGLSPLGIALAEPLLAFICLQIPLFFAGFHPEDVLDWFSRYSEGFTVGSVRFYPMDILFGFGLFVALIFLFKTVQWFLSGRVFPHTKLDAGVKNAVISLIGYAGILLALLSLLSTLGINTANLAIVAGALSVGIGFGLQAIISNFVSGLILLFERPVRVGDWVSVGSTEGFVKKIRVRSTLIETFQQADVLVPNSQFITEVVKNWTLNSPSGRVEIQVGVAYGSDTEKVKEILLETAKSHPQCKPYPGPSVLFTGFGDSSLNFELRCFIRDITSCLVVKSDLCFAIDKAFREADIEIPFPQRDVHLRDVPAEMRVRDSRRAKPAGAEAETE